MGDLLLLAKKHWVAAVVTIAAFLWDLGINLVLQKGYLNGTPDGVCFALLVGPIVLLIILAIFHPETHKRKYWSGENKVMSIMLILIALVIVIPLILFFYHITHLRIKPLDNSPPQPATLFTNEVISTSGNNSPIIFQGGSTGAVANYNWGNTTVVGNSNSFGNTYIYSKCTFITMTTVIYMTQAIASLTSQAVLSVQMPADVVELTNQFALAEISLSKNDYQAAYYHSSEAIQIIENPTVTSGPLISEHV